MLVKEAIQILHNHTGKNISQVEVAQILEMSPLALNKRVTRQSELKISEAVKLIQHYGYNLFDDCVQNVYKITNCMEKYPDAVEVIYYENQILTDTIKNPLITSIWLDRELVHDVWKKDEKNLRILKMPGDSMDGGETPIRNQDMLLIDLTCKDILSSGIYVYTTSDDNFLFVNGIKQTVDGSIVFYYYNKTHGETLYKPQDLKKVNFKIIGRVLKNMTEIM